MVTTHRIDLPSPKLAFSGQVRAAHNNAFTDDQLPHSVSTQTLRFSARARQRISVTGMISLIGQKMTSQDQANAYVGKIIDALEDTDFRTRFIAKVKEHLETKFPSSSQRGNILVQALVNPAASQEDLENAIVLSRLIHDDSLETAYIILFSDINKRNQVLVQLAKEAPRYIDEDVKHLIPAIQQKLKYLQNALTNIYFNEYFAG